MHPTLVWMEDDLRLHDHPALHAAAQAGEPVIPLFLWDGGPGWADGSASRWWLHHSLVALERELHAAGIPLLIARGDPAERLPQIAAELNAGSVFWMQRPDPARQVRDDGIGADLRRSGLQVRTYGGALLHEPEAIRTGSGGPYQVFTPFYRKFRERVRVSPPLPAPRFKARQPSPPGSLRVAELELLPEIDWAEGLRATWTPGESGARERLAAFVGEPAMAYAQSRDQPAESGTSMLSPHLHFGEVSARTVWHAVEAAGPSGSAEPYLRQLAWREFGQHLLHHFPHVRREPLRDTLAAFPWRDDPEALEAWRRGRTGYPIVDAGMRQLWETGWMHNRVRMIVASFLAKDLLVHWQHGMDWFHDTLVDADTANNSLGWQWAAGCGADAQPFFRIFNPVTQGRKFDGDGRYVRRWIPELARLPDKSLHAPWEASEAERRLAGVVLGKDYPEPVVDHAWARDRALKAYAEVRGG